MTIGTLASPPPPMLEVLERLPTSSMSERQLVDGYSRSVGRVPAPGACACGGQISVDDGDDLAEVLALHYGSPEHRRSAWGRAIDQAGR
jgi:hypothetical protein